MKFGPISINLAADWHQARRFQSLWVAAALLLFAVVQYLYAPLSRHHAAITVLVLVVLFIAMRYYKASNKRALWRASSVLASALLAVLSVLQSEVLPLAQPVVPPEYWPYVLLAFGAAIPLLRLMKQAALHASNEGTEEPKA
ncbi:hypothetical protein ACQV5M_18890 [Leptospira sp. SA-E8]|uniref:hypothetical protein n=1 Tax=Leptospira sp. SA-E8 TaxID=3422259 RepID=UPI003EBE0299